MISFGVIGYTVASATLLLLNKLAIHHLQAPSIILTLQLFSCAVSVRAAGAAGYCVVDELEWGKIRAFGTASFTFVILIFTNIKTLQHANVETFIVFRTSTPVLISVGEWMFLGRELPTARNWVCLVLLVGGASAYVATDQAFDPYAGYRWVALWYAVFVFDQLYIKHVISTVPMASNWGRVYYNNLLALAPLLATGAVTDELTAFRQHSSAVGLGWCMASCVAGTGMSYFSFRARGELSATHFTVVGNLCKVATVVLNILIWDRHASGAGLGALLLCLGAGYAYSAAPMRADFPRGKVA